MLNTFRPFDEHGPVVGTLQKCLRSNASAEGEIEICLGLCCSGRDLAILDQSLGQNGCCEHCEAEGTWNWSELGLEDLAGMCVQGELHSTNLESRHLQVLVHGFKATLGHIVTHNHISKVNSTCNRMR